MAGEPDQPGLALLADRPLINDQPTAYVCRQFVCRLPVTSVEDLASSTCRASYTALLSSSDQRLIMEIAT